MRPSKKSIVRTITKTIMIIVGISFICLQQYLGQRDGITLLHMFSFVVLYYLWYDMFKKYIREKN